MVRNLYPPSPIVREETNLETVGPKVLIYGPLKQKAVPDKLRCLRLLSLAKP